MWLAIIFIIQVSTGESGFLVNQLPQYDQAVCQAIAQDMAARLEEDKDFLIYDSCIYVPDGEDI